MFSLSGGRTVERLRGCSEDELRSTPRRSVRWLWTSIMLRRDGRTGVTGRACENNEWLWVMTCCELSVAAEYLELLCMFVLRQCPLLYASFMSNTQFPCSHRAFCLMTVWAHTHEHYFHTHTTTLVRADKWLIVSWIQHGISKWNIWSQRGLNQLYLLRSTEGESPPCVNACVCLFLCVHSCV